MSAEQSLSALSLLLQNGGPVIAILILMSMLMLTVALWKLVQFSAMRLWRYRALDDKISAYLAGYGAPDILAEARASANPVLSMLGRVQALYAARRDDADIAAEVRCTASESIETMRSGLRIIELIATLSPLLGLLGTVLGMIEAFQQLQLDSSQVDPSVLSGGIWMALLTTAAGLAVAVPAVALHNFFEAVVERTALRMERVATRVQAIPATRQTAE